MPQTTQRPLMQTKRTVVTTTTHTGQITAADIRKHFDLPEDAEITITVPSGGDWAGVPVRVDECPLQITWDVTHRSHEPHE